MQEANDILEKYKRHPFARGLIPFQGAIRTIDHQFAKVYAHQDGRQRWTMYDRTTGEPAIFSHAAMFAESDDQESGNYVPEREQIPYGVDVKSVQRRANMKCFYTYIFDTHTDLSLYEGQWTLDEYMGTVKGFNEGGVPRRSYLSGQDSRFRGRFWMQTPMFLRRGPQEARVPCPEHLHPWVVKGDSESKVFRANTDRPRIWMKAGDDIVPISNRSPATLHRGDIVAMSFTITYHVTSANWFPQFHPVDLVVVRDGDMDATDLSAPALDLYSRPPLSLEAIPEVDGEADFAQHPNTPVSPGGPNTVGPASEGVELEGEVGDTLQEGERAQSSEDFVDVTMEETQKRDTRAGVARAARGRKRA